MIRKIGLALLLTLLWPGTLLAQAELEPERGCSDDAGVDRCAAEEQARQRARFGLSPIEAHRDAGDQVRRVFYVDGYGRDLVAIVFIRAPGREPVVQLHFPRRAEGAEAPSPLEASVPERTWDEMLFRSALFDRALVPLPADPDRISICLHSWIYTVEASDPPDDSGRPAGIRRATRGACQEGLVQSYAIEAQRAVLPLFAACARLDPTRHRNEAAQLAACGMLRGDRMAAAEVLNRIDGFRDRRGPDGPGDLAGFFARDATVEWNGARHQGGSAGAFWSARAAENGNAHFFPQTVEGLSSRRVRATGIVSRIVDMPGRPSVIHRARVDQIWVLGPARIFQIERATVGPFEPMPERP